MMVSLGVYMRQWQRILRRWMLDPKLHLLTQGVAYIGAGFMLSAASLRHIPLPLALSLVCAASGWPGVLLACGGLSGYLVFWGSAGSQGAMWIGLGLLAAVTLGGRQAVRELPVLMCAMAGLIVAGTGLAFQIWQGDGTPVLLYLLRILMAAGATRLFQVAMERRDPVIDWLVCGVGVLALAQVVPVPYLGLGYVAAGLLAAAGAFPAAALAGLALDLAQVTPVPMTAVLSLSYLVRLIPVNKRWFPPLASGLVYMTVMSLCGLLDLYPLPGLVAGSLISLALPKGTALSQRRGETGFAQVRLEMASSVMNQTQMLLQDVEDPPVDETALVVRAAERACGSCPCRKNCREKPEQMSPELLHKPLGNGADLPLRCRKSGRLLLELRRSQEQLRTIRADRDRRMEYRAAVAQQYQFLSDYLQDVSDSLAQRANPPQQRYQPELGVYSASREAVNGDKCFWFAGVECRYYLILCDGMGTGAEAAREGRAAGEILKGLLAAGYPPEYALRTLNSLCALRGQAGAVTVDLAELKLDTGRVSVYKWGAAPSYVISRGETVKIGTATLPPGLSVTDGRETVERLSLRKGETLVLLSDGAGGEEALHRAWVSAAEPPGELAEKILQYSQPDNADDATVAVVRLRSVPVST